MVLKIDKMIRAISQHLGDMLKQSENADLKTAFLAYDAKAEKGWTWLKAGSEEDLKFAKLSGMQVKPSMFTPEQTARWEELIQAAGMDDMTGGAESFTYLLTQSYLGKLDVWDDNNS